LKIAAFAPLRGVQWWFYAANVVRFGHPPPLTPPVALRENRRSSFWGQP
jgi:hypothetical protein